MKVPTTSTPKTQPSDADSYTLVKRLPRKREGAMVVAAESWPLPTSIEDPRLGLTFEQLTASLTEAGVSLTDLVAEDGETHIVWNETAAAELRQAVWLILSRQLGHATGDRKQRILWARQLQRVLFTRPNDRATLPFEAYVADAVLMGEQSTQDDRNSSIAFGSAVAPWRRMELAGSFTRPNSGAKIKVKHVRDYDAVSLAWEDAAEDKSVMPLLPVALLCAAYPARRRYAGQVPNAKDPENPTDLFVPSVWETLAVAIALGPSAMITRAHRGVRTMIDSGAGLSDTTLERGTHAVNKLAKLVVQAAADLSAHTDGGGVPGITVDRHRDFLGRWHNAPRAEVTPAQKKRVQLQRAKKEKDARLAPHRLWVRFWLAEYERQYAEALRAEATGRPKKAKIKRDRKKAEKEGVKPAAVVEDIAWEDSGPGKALHKLVRLSVAADLGVRVNEWSGITRRDIRASYAFGGGLESPAVFIDFSKDPQSKIPPHWFPIHQRTYELLQAWCDGAGITEPEAPIFYASRFAKYEPTTSDQAGNDFRHQRVLPVQKNDRDKRDAHGAHDMRSLKVQMSLGVGDKYLDADPDLRDEADRHVFAYAATGHAYGKNQHHDYLKLKTNRELWAARAALGCPAKGVPGTLALLHDEIGQAARWDDGALAGLLTRRRHLEDAKAAAEKAHAEIRREVRAMDRQMKRLAVGAKVTIERDDVMQGVVNIQEQGNHNASLWEVFADRLEAGGRMKDAEAQIKVSDAQIETIDERLKVFTLTGKTMRISDLDRASLAFADETFDEVLIRVGQSLNDSDVIDPASGDNSETLGLARTATNVNETAEILAVSPKTARRYILKGWMPTPIGKLDVSDAVINVSERKCGIDWAKLAPGWEQHFTLGQRQQLDAIRVHPMGEAGYKGAKDLAA
jgi:hypothetical protein